MRWIRYNIFRAVVFTPEGRVMAAVSQEFKQHYPNPAGVERPGGHTVSQTESLRAAVRKAGISASEIASIGITNQRETTLVWDKRTGKCVYNAIVWQCRRTAELVEKIKSEGHTELIRSKTGLVPDAYFSATKIQWILKHLNLQERAEKGELCFGTVDSF